jgi:hypothetical protein
VTCRFETEAARLARFQWRTWQTRPPRRRSLHRRRDHHWTWIDAGVSKLGLLLDATLNQARRLAAIGGFSNPAGFPAHRYEDMEAEFLS